MNTNFIIKDGIYLVQPPHELDLHNNFDFTGFNYSIEKRTLVLDWKRSSGDWITQDTPEFLTIEFNEVSEFRFLPRDSEKPFTEDDCLSDFGYWTDEDWSDGVFTINENQKPEEDWLTALDFSLVP